MKVLLTGAAGFIGGHAYDYFTSKNDEVLVVDKFSYAADLQARKRISNLIELDICDHSLLDVVADFCPEFIINFAAETHVDNSIINNTEFIKSNILGTTNILDICKRLNVKLCHISTDEVYGPAYSFPFTENDKLSPMNPYSATKASADLMISAYHNTHSVQYLIVRPSNNYGPRQNKEKFIPKLIDSIINEKKMPLYGNGNQLREWTYVEDTCKAIRKCYIF
jgi:dTDP-glucose 4,6-dehydratase